MALFRQAYIVTKWRLCYALSHFAHCSCRLKCVISPTTYLPLILASDSVFFTSHKFKASLGSKMTSKTPISFTTILKTDSCSLCLKDFSDPEGRRECPVTLQCGHTFGSLCLMQWVHAAKRPNRSCPMVCPCPLLYDCNRNANLTF